MIKIIKKYFYNFLLLLTIQMGIKSCELEINNLEITNLIEQRKINKKKDWLFLIYMAANNDLYPYAIRNIRETAKNTPENVYIIIQTAEPGSKKTKRYLVEKNKATLLNPNETLKLDSGKEETLTDFILWSTKHYPSEHILLDLWDHGTGCIDIDYRKSINPAELFKMNPQSMLLELDRTRGYLSLFEQSRGVCFDETYGTFLTNEKLELSLSKATKELGKKIDIVGFDACLMSMFEIGDILEPFVDYMVASQEVELGAGWRYDLILNAFKDNHMSPKDLAIEITKVYKIAYYNITNDYTLSAIDLSKIKLLKNEIDSFAKLLIRCLKEYPSSEIKKELRLIKTNNCFDEPTFIDLKSLCNSFVDTLKNKTKKNIKTDELIKIFDEVTNKINFIIDDLVLAKVNGPNMFYANGLSIYLPEKRIHHSYKLLNFFNTNSWGRFIENYIE